MKNYNILNKCRIFSNDWVYLYPEGNVYCEKSKDSNDKFCKENNIQPTKNCLYPRFGALDIISKNNPINTIYTLCTQYDNLKPSKKYPTLLNHQLPNNIYINIMEKHVDDMMQDTIKIFRNIDNYLNNEIDITSYSVMKKNTLELGCLIFHILLFCYNIYLLSTNYLYGGYLVTVLPLYYLYVLYTIR